MTTKRVVLARLGAPHGVRGEIRIQIFAANPAALRGYGPLASGDGRRFEIAALRRQGDTTVARLAGVSDRDAAAALTGLELGIARERLPAAGEDEHYHADLIGLRAETPDGTVLGTVVAVPNYGAGDLLEIAPPRGQSLLVPFTLAAVPTIDIAGGRAVIDPPAGLLVAGSPQEPPVTASDDPDARPPAAGIRPARPRPRSGPA